MHYVLLEAYPTTEHPDSKDVGGAYVGVYVRDGSLREAEAVAYELVAEAGWRVASLESSHEVAVDAYSDDNEARAYAEQAEIDGVVAVFHSWPRDAPDA